MIRRLVVTLVCVGLYWLGLQLPLPLLDDHSLKEVGNTFGATAASTSFFSLGVTPFVTGFMLVELISLTTPLGRRLRRDGVAGRRKLNRAALALSTVVAALQAFGIAAFLTRLSTPAGAPLTGSPLWLLVVTVTATAFAAAALAETISRWGLTNGFAVLLVAPSIPQLLSAIVSTPFAGGPGDPFAEPETRIMNLIWTGLLAALIVVFVRRRPRTHLTTPDGGSLSYRLPPFPQGLFPVTLSYSLLGIVTNPAFGREGPLLALDFYAYYGALATGIALLSAVGAWMFTTRRRVEANLEGLAAVPEEEYDRPWGRQLVLATVVLAGLEAGLAALSGVWEGFDLSLIRFGVLLPLVVVVLDAVDTARLAGTGRLEHVLTLDNVHLAEYLRARLEEEEIECVVTAFRYRRLAYFFGALFKMALLVPAEDRERAERLVEETPFEIV